MSSASVLMSLLAGDYPTTNSLHSTALTELRVKVTVTLRLAVYRQSIHLGGNSFEVHDQTFFL
jgi:hypothetical protein